LAVLEAALPEEAGMMAFCGRIWAVTAPLEIRIQRLMASRGYTREKCLGIIASQRGEKEFEEMAAAVIDNGGGREETERQLDRLVRDLLTA
jgi:dephospho-CoA kinase